MQLNNSALSQLIFQNGKYWSINVNGVAQISKLAVLQRHPTMTTYYHNNEKYIFDTHRFPQHIPHDAKYLIIGTFPTLEKNLEYDFYYSSKTNIFWPIMEEIFGYKFKNNKGELAVSERKDFMTHHKIGMTDMIEACYRKQYSSQDKAIIPIRLRDILSVIDNNKTIETIILASRTGLISAEGLFRSLFLIENNTLELTKLDTGMRIGEFQRGRKINVFVPYSTSNSFHEGDQEKYRQVKQMYSHCFDKHNR